MARAVPFSLRNLGGYPAALALVAAAALAGLAGEPWVAGGNVTMLFLLAVLVAALGFGLGPALLAALTAAVTYNFYFLEPRHTFEIGHAADLITFTVFFAAAVIAGGLAGRARDAANVTARRARTVAALLDASRALSAAASIEDAAQALADQVRAAGAGAAIVLVPENGVLRIAGGPPGFERLGAAADAAARAAWAGGTGDDPDWRFRPLEGLHGRVGLIGLRPAAGGTDAEGPLAALLSQGAVAMERAGLASAAAENQALRQADALRSALLNSVSHDFRTPLSTVLGASTTLIDYEAELKPDVRRDLLQSIAEEARRLNRYVRDLLDMARLEGGALKPRRVETDLEAVIDSALARLGEQLGARRVVRDVAPGLTAASLDPTLLEQALLNLVENAAAYSPAQSVVRIGARRTPEAIALTVEDEGPGIAVEDLGRVFDRFHRLRRPSDRGSGLGLGLSIAKGFVEAMGGRIAAESPVAEGRGTRIVVTLPDSPP
jgi:two-component system, OmpR family, sensor histidine kinase KdpD